MANAKKCDICAKFYVPPLGTYIEPGYALLRVGVFSSGSQLDLCTECNNELNNFVESMKECSKTSND